MVDKIFPDEKVHELKLGRSFDSDNAVAFHSLYYDFKPASIDTAKPAAVNFETGSKVTVTVPHVAGATERQTVYSGSKQAVQKDYALIINHRTGEVTLEKLSYKLSLKKTRSERERPNGAQPPKKQKFETSNTALAAPSTSSTMKSNAPSPSLPEVATNGLKQSTVASKSADQLSASSSSSSESSDSESSNESSSDSDDETPRPSSARKPVTAIAAAAAPKSMLLNSALSVAEDLHLSTDSSDSD